MNALHKSIFIAFLWFASTGSGISQIITSTNLNFRIVNEYGKSLTCKQIYQTDNVHSDTVKFIRIVFQDQLTTLNNGYIVLNSQDYLKQFISDLEILMSKLNTNEVIAITKLPYAVDINNQSLRRVFQNNLNKKVCIYEPESKTFIAFKEDKLKLLVENLKNIRW